VAKRILVVEDNDLNRKLFCDLLKANGFAVEPIADGRDVLVRAREFVPNLIIMDIQLPEVSGLDITRWMKADDELASIPIIAVTAFAMRGDEERFREGGCQDYLSKPISVATFIGAVRKFIG
jgi:two-component system cell cycle response regulator DivK